MRLGSQLDVVHLATPHSSKRHLLRQQHRPIRDEKRLIDLYVWINRYKGLIFSRRIDGQPLAGHEKRGPFFVFTTDAGYGIARRFFKVPETPKPDIDHDADVPTLGELMLHEAGIRRTR